ncbi:unnamed protein product [Prunus brigantina]
MTGLPSSSNPKQAPPPAVEISPENRREKLGFDRNFAGFVLRRSTTIFGDPDSGHFRSVFGERPRIKALLGLYRIRRIVKRSPRYSGNANPRVRVSVTVRS